MKKSLSLALLLLLAFSCKIFWQKDEPIAPTAPVSEPTAPVAPIAQPEDDFTNMFEWKNKVWSVALVSALANSKLLTVKPSDRYDFGWKDGKDPIIFWGNIMVAIAKYESDWNPNATFKESFNDNAGDNVLSSGLFQISLESSQGYDCGFKKQEELFDAVKNINCSVKIVEKWVVKDGCIACKYRKFFKTHYYGISRYFSVTRGVNAYTRRSLAGIMRANK